MTAAFHFFTQFHFMLIFVYFPKMGKTAAERISNFARDSKERLSGKKKAGVRPKESKKLPMVVEMEDKSGGVRPRPPSIERDATAGLLNTSIESRASSDINDLSRSPPAAPESGRGANCCILCVGSTGTGKSATISKLTEQRVKSGNSLKRVTQKCRIYRPVYHSKNCIFDKEKRNVFFVDTVGWEDADYDDNDTFKDILRFVDANNIVNIKAVIWTVNKNVRQDALLNRQASLINKFCEKEIWDRVVIVCKQTINPMEDCRGALAAGLDYNPRANIQTAGYHFMEDSSFTMDQTLALENDPKMREMWNVKTDEEVREEFRNIFEYIGEPVKIVFNDQRCLDCGAIGDPRLLPKFCHMKRAMVHRVRHPERVHPLKIESFHPEDIPIKTHPGYMHNSPWYKSLRKKQIYSCCGGKLTSPGCALKWKCCGQQHRINNQLPERNSLPVLGCKKKYSCCNQEVDVASEGCEQLYTCCGRNKNQEPCLAICVKCEKEWGSEADKCYIRQHNVADIDLEPKASVPKVKDQFETIKRVENGLPSHRTFLEKCELPSTLPFPII